MTIKISQIYQKRKIVYIYLDTNEEIQNLKKQIGDNKVLLHLGTWQMWGERAIENAWKNKTHDLIIWPYQTSRLNRWVVLVISIKDGKAAIHTASQKTEHAKAEKEEIKNFLGGLEGFNFSDEDPENPKLDTDDGLKIKDESGSAYLAICYVKTALEQISKNSYDYEFSSSGFDEVGEGGKSLLEEVEEEYKSILTQIQKLTKLEEIEKELELRSKKEKYKKARKDGQSWTLTGQESSRIDQAASIEDLEKVVGDIMQERDAAEKIDNWIKDHISSKTKLEELPKETDIDSNAEIPSSAKEKVKLKLQEKIVELMPETTTEEKIKKHLTGVLNKWKKWEYLFDNNRKDDEDYGQASMFNQNFRGAVAKKMAPEIKNAIETNTLKGYQDLDESWSNEARKDGKVKYNEDLDYYGAWKTLREYLSEEKANKDEWMKVWLQSFYGEDKFIEVENLYQTLQLK
jgi:hypothetical protein